MIPGKLLFAVCLTILLGACASPREMLGWAKDEPFVLTAADKSEFATSAPVFSKGLGQVAFDMGRVCLGCGDFSDLNGIGIDHINQRLKYDFPALLKQQLAQTTLFLAGDASLLMSAKLTDITQHSSVGGQAERKSPMTSGAVLTTKVTVQYDLLDKGQVVGTWIVTTAARSNSLAASTRLTENIDGALKRNLRALLLRIVADHSPNDAARANRALASLQSEVDNKRIALGYLVYGATKTVTTTAGVVGDGLTVVAQNSGAIADSLNATSATMARSNREYNEAYTKAVLARRDQTVGPPGGHSRQSKDSESSTRKDSAKSTDSVNKSSAASSAATAKNASGAAVSVAQADQEAQKERVEKAEKDTQERARKEAEAKAQADRQRKEEAAKEEQLRQQRAKEKAAREAKEKADALAAKTAEETARKNYLKAMIQGVRLRATKCPDGEGKYYATGTRPRIKPEVVSCLDVHYRAYCAGSTQYSAGVAHNFIGMSGCFGDTYDINPKPGCKVEEVRIEVVDAKECR